MHALLLTRYSDEHSEAISKYLLDAARHDFDSRIMTELSIGDGTKADRRRRAFENHVYGHAEDQKISPLLADFYQYLVYDDMEKENVWSETLYSLFNAVADVTVPERRYEYYNTSQHFATGRITRQSEKTLPPAANTEAPAQPATPFFEKPTAIDFALQEDTFRLAFKNLPSYRQRGVNPDVILNDLKMVYLNSFTYRICQEMEKSETYSALTRETAFINTLGQIVDNKKSMFRAYPKKNKHCSPAYVDFFENQLIVCVENDDENISPEDRTVYKEFRALFEMYATMKGTEEGVLAKDKTFSQHYYLAVHTKDTDNTAQYLEQLEYTRLRQRCKI